MGEINTYDFVVFGLLLVSAIIGLARGFTREILGIAAWVGAAVVSVYGIILVRPLLTHYIKNPFVADVVAGLILFVIALFFFGSISRSVSIKVKGSVLGGLDRSLGFLFGILRGGIVIAIVYFFTSLIWNVEKWPEEIKKAKMYPYVVDSADWIRNSIPQDAIKNLGLKAVPKEEGTLQNSVENMVHALSQPKPAGAAPDGNAPETKKEEGYADTHRDDMERLVKNNEKK